MAAPGGLTQASNRATVPKSGAIASTPIARSSHTTSLHNGEIVEESERTARPHDLFWPWFAANVSVFGISYGTYVLGFGLSFLQAVLMAIAILLVHTYFGYFASGGPSGVGAAVGNAVRTSLVVVVSVTLLVSLSIYGSNGNFNLSG